MPSQLVAEWTRAAVLAENAATSAEDAATAAAAYEAARVAERAARVAERAWTAVQSWAANAGLDAVITATGAGVERGPLTPAEALAANAIADAEDDLLGDYYGLRWTPDAHGDVRHVTCTGATEWDVCADGLVRIRRLDTRIDRGADLASATIRADGKWRAEVSASADETDLTRLCECVEAALGMPQGAATRGVMLGCDPFDLRRRAERGDARAAAALLPLTVAMRSVAMQSVEVVQ